MSQYKKSVNEDYKKLDLAMKENQIGNFYIFHGEEHYLRDRYLEMLRKNLCPNGLDGFNYRRFEGADLTSNVLENSIDMLPVFAERTLIEIHDFDLFSKKADNSSTESPLVSILSTLPDYVCVLFVFNTVVYKPDKRLKATKEIIKHAQIIEFAVQHQSNLIKWMTSHYSNIGKRIGKSEAEYLIHITGGFMAAIKNEIEKTAAHSKSDYITRADIDAVVIPVLDAVVYQLTDSLIKREHKKAMKILDELLRMREAPQKLIFSISLKFRQLLAARICIENNLGKSSLVEMCSLTHDFQAGMLFDTARKSTLPACRQAVIDCAKAAFDLNSAPDPESRMIELVAKLALSKV